MFVLWELPLARLLQYHHCALRAADVWTIPPRPPVAAQLAALEAFAAGDTENEE